MVSSALTLWYTCFAMSGDGYVGPDGRVCFREPVHALGTNGRAAGQVEPSTSFGQALAALASRPDVTRILEIGTWFGGGSTYSMAAALQRAKGRTNCARSSGADNGSPAGVFRCCRAIVLSLESHRPAWEIARTFLHALPVWAILGTAVSAAEMLPESQIPEKDEHFRLYYIRDRDAMAAVAPQLPNLCARFSPFDLILIDGNEYTGFAEFLSIKRHCRPLPLFLALHDTGTLKTAAIVAQIQAHRDLYLPLLSKGQNKTSAPRACRLLRCRPESTFAPNSAGWAVYVRADAEAAVLQSLAVGEVL